MHMHFAVKVLKTFSHHYLTHPPPSPSQVVLSYLHIIRSTYKQTDLPPIRALVRRTIATVESFILSTRRLHKPNVKKSKSGWDFLSLSLSVCVI